MDIPDLIPSNSRPQQEFEKKVNESFDNEKQQLYRSSQTVRQRGLNM